MSIRKVELNKIYEFNHSRKGTFTAKVINLIEGDGGTEDDVDVEIVSGKAKYINQRDAAGGDVIRIRLGLCHWHEVE